MSSCIRPSRDRPRNRQQLGQRKARLSLVTRPSQNRKDRETVLTITVAGDAPGPGCEGGQVLLPSTSAPTCDLTFTVLDSRKFLTYKPPLVAQPGKLLLRSQPSVPII